MRSVALSICLCTWLCLPVFASKLLDSACASYARHDYSGSLKQLDSLPYNERGPKSDYYRALNLQGLHRFNEAREQFQKVANQRRDLKLAALAKQGVQNLSRLHAAYAKVDQRGLGTDENWQVVKPGFGAQGKDYKGLPSNWTFQKTKEGCGRH